jgi:SAP domain-containing new25/Domain of unknown function (DUF6434)
MPRPNLHAPLSPTEFDAWYWLKDELLAFCRSHDLTTSGSKPEVAARVRAFLAGTAAPKPTARVARRGVMPVTFSLRTKIGAGWRCTPTLGAFLRSQCGPQFRFNAAVREFIHGGVGRTLKEAVDCYRASVAPGVAKRALPAQLEYNRHMQQFFATNPGATRADALASWWVKRATRAKR